MLSSLHKTRLYAKISFRIDSETNGTWDFDYDDEGKLEQKTQQTTGEIWLYSYDHHNRLTGAQRKPDATLLVDKELNYIFDVFGNRIKRSVDPDGAGAQTETVEKIAYENGNAWADLDASGNITMRRFYLGGFDSLFARIDHQGDLAWYLTDRLGS